MERIVGYYITPSLVHSLATNPKLIGIWHWSDVIKPDNHDRVAPPDLFLAACELAITPGKPRGAPSGMSLPSGVGCCGVTATRSPS